MFIQAGAASNLILCRRQMLSFMVLTIALLPKAPFADKAVGGPSSELLGKQGEDCLSPQRC